MDNYTDEELCETLRHGEESEVLRATELAADRIEELLELVERLNNTVLSLTEPF